MIETRELLNQQSRIINQQFLITYLRGQFHLESHRNE